MYMIDTSHSDTESDCGLMSAVMGSTGTNRILI